MMRHIYILVDMLIDKIVKFGEIRTQDQAQKNKFIHSE